MPMKEAESVRDVDSKALENRAAKAREALFRAKREVSEGRPQQASEHGSQLKELTRIGVEAAQELKRRRDEESRLDEARRRLRIQPKTATRKVLEVGHPELVGQRLDASRLSDEELRELDALVDRLRRDGLDDESTRRYELLVGNAAGAAELFARKRHEAADEERLLRAADDLHVSLLVRRPKLAEPGSIELPRLLYKWVAEHPADFAVLDLGVWALVALALENEDASLFHGAVGGARIERDEDGEPVMTFSVTGLADVRLRARADSELGNGAISRSLGRLELNELIAVKRVESGIGIRRGKLGRRLREGPR